MAVPVNRTDEEGAGARPKQARAFPHIPFPFFNWKAHNKLANFEEWEEQITVLLRGQEVPEHKWHMYILNQTGKEGWARWKTIKEKVNKDNPKEVFAAFCKGMEISVIATGLPERLISMGCHSTPKRQPQS